MNLLRVCLSSLNALPWIWLLLVLVGPKQGLTQAPVTPDSWPNLASPGQQDQEDPAQGQRNDASVPQDSNRVFPVEALSMIPADSSKPSRAVGQASTQTQNPTTLSRATGQIQNLSPRHVAVVCPLTFQESLRPWIAYRQSQGYQIHVITEPNFDRSSFSSREEPVFQSPMTSAGQIRQKIQQLASQVPLFALVLIGDAAPTTSTTTGWRDILPAARVPAQMIQKIGDEDSIASDSFYADLDGDGFPDFPVGRLPIRTPEELREVTQKILHYETELSPGPWQRRINVIAGVGGLSPLLDNVVETVARKIFSKVLPGEFELTLTQANWKSVYCPSPNVFREVVLERINEGSLLTVYLGHGYHQGLDIVQTPEADYPIFEWDDIAALNCQASPILFFFACYTGAFDASESCLAEEMVLQPRGPVAVIASSRMTMPYGMSVFGIKLIEDILRSQNGLPLASGNPPVSASQTFLDSDTTPSAVPQTDAPRTLGELVWSAQYQQRLWAQRCKNEEQDRKMRVEKYKEERRSRSEKSEIEEISRAGQSSTGADSIGQSSAGADLEENQGGTPTQEGDFAVRETSDRPLKRFLQKESIETPGDFLEKIDKMAGVFDPFPIYLGEQVEDHVRLFNLFGDPLLRIRLPKLLTVHAPDTVYSNEPVLVSGSIPGLNANFSSPLNATVELVYTRDRSPVKKPSRKEFSLTPDDMMTYQSIYDQANHPVVVSLEAPVKEGRFEIQLPPTELVSGSFDIRVFLNDGRNAWVGSRPLSIHPCYSQEKERSTKTP